MIVAGVFLRMPLMTVNRHKYRKVRRRSGDRVEKLRCDVMDRQTEK